MKVSKGLISVTLLFIAQLPREAGTIPKWEKSGHSTASEPKSGLRLRLSGTLEGRRCERRNSNPGKGILIVGGGTPKHLNLDMGQDPIYSLSLSFLPILFFKLTTQSRVLLVCEALEGGRLMKGTHVEYLCCHREMPHEWNSPLRPGDDSFLNIWMSNTVYSPRR